jgi:hypothetical protein
LSSHSEKRKNGTDDLDDLKKFKEQVKKPNQAQGRKRKIIKKEEEPNQAQYSQPNQS